MDNNYLNNLMRLTDSYKVTHWRQYKLLKKMISYVEARGVNSSSDHLSNSVAVFGLQYFIKKFLVGGQMTHAKITEAKPFWISHFGNKDPFVVNENGLICKSDAASLTTIDESSKKLIAILDIKDGHGFPCEWIYIITKLDQSQVWTSKTLERAIYDYGRQNSINYNDVNALVPFENKSMGGWRDVVDYCGGYVPVIISGLPEGTVTKIGTPLVVIENSSDPIGEKFAWVTNYLETLLMEIWYPITIASNSFALKMLLTKAYMKVHPQIPVQIASAIVSFQMHDFGFRGVSSVETASLGAAAHLLSFMGTDTAAGIEMLQNFYSAGLDVSKIAQSVPATEHSVMTSYGRENEIEAFEHMLNEFGCSHVENGREVIDGPIASIVADSYNVYRIIALYLGIVLRDLVNMRKNQFNPLEGKFGKVVVRPDSGDPLEMVILLTYLLHNTFTEGDKVKVGQVLPHLMTLPDHLGLLQGDGINFKSTASILANLIKLNIDTSHMVFGSGGGLLQSWNRDSLSFAIKACLAVLPNGQELSVAKEPITAPGKVSMTYEQVCKNFAHVGCGSVHENVVYDWRQFSGSESSGKLVREETLETIRDRINNQLVAILSNSEHPANKTIEKCLTVNESEHVALIERVKYLDENMPMFASQTEKDNIVNNLCNLYPEKADEVCKFGKHAIDGLSRALTHATAPINQSISRSTDNAIYVSEMCLASIATTLGASKKDIDLADNLMKIVGSSSLSKDNKTVKKYYERYASLRDNM